MNKESTLALIVPLAPGDAINAGLLAMLERASGRHEVMVATAGEDNLSLPDGITQVAGTAGRGRQLNRAAERVGAQWLWFVHADCQPGSDTFQAVECFIARGRDALGYCRLQFLHDGPRLALLNAWGANLRSRLLGLPYGDQGLCLPRTWFQRLGGFREDLQRGEDLDLVARARQAGLPVRAMGATLATSARRYREQGWVRTTLGHQVAAWRLLRGARRHSPSESS